MTHRISDLEFVKANAAYQYLKDEFKHGKLSANDMKTATAHYKTIEAKYYMQLNGIDKTNEN